MNDTTERVLAPLVGLTLRGARRDHDALVVQFGERRTGDSGGRTAGHYELRVYCAWRLVDALGIAAGSGDLFTPADPEAELETFDWDVPGGSWLDLRLREFTERHASPPPVVSTFVTDAFAGFRLALTEGVELDVLPNSSPSEHVETEFWRLTRPGEADAEIVAGTAGIEMVDGGTG